MMGGKLPHASVTTRASGMSLQQALLGAVVPVLFGTRRVSMNLIWYGDFVSKQAQKGGSGASKGGASYVYNASILGLICEGGNGVDAIDSVWDQSGMYQVQAVSESFTVPVVAPYTYTVVNNGPGVFNSDNGLSAVTPFSVATNDFGNPNGPVTLTGNQLVPLRLVSGTPGVGEYTFDATGTYTFNAAQAGTQIQLSYTFFIYVLNERELASVPNGGGTVTVTHQPDFAHDLGVFYFPSGVALHQVGGSPSVGQYNPNGGNYQFAAADQGAGIVINYQWNNPAVDQNGPTSLNLTLINGENGQAPWAHLTSLHPTQALGYPGCALIGSASLYLGFTPTLPNYSFECGSPYAFGGGIPDCCPSDAIQQVLTNVLFGVGMDPKWIDSSLQGLARAYWLSNRFFISDFLNTQTTAAAVIGKYCEASLVAPFWSEGRLKFIPAGTQSAVGNGAIYQPPTNPIVEFTDTDYTPAKGKDPIVVSRVPWQDAFNDVRVEWSVRINSYNRDIMEARDEASIDRFGYRPEGPRSYNFLCDAVSAQFAANLRLQRLQGVKNNYEFTVKPIFPYLEPMDVVEITDPKLIGTGATIPVRITKISEDPKKGMSITAEDLPFQVFNTVLYPRESSVPTYDLTTSRSAPVNTSVLAVEIPAALVNGQGNTIYIFATGQGTNWGGCDIYVSLDNISYNFLTNIKHTARFGVLTAPLPSHADPDTVDTLSVNMLSPDTTLQSVPTSTADALATLSGLIDSFGNLEFISYANVELTGNTTYALTYLRRGQLGTTPRTFAATSDFVRMDEASAQYQYAESFVGQTLYIKALSYNIYNLQPQSLADVEPLVVPLSGTTAVVVGNLTITASTPLNPQASINPLAVGASATITSNPAGPTIDTAVTGGTIYRPDGSTITVPSSGPNHNSLWNSSPVAYPPVPGTGTTYRHFGGNVVWKEASNLISFQEYGPIDNTSPANPWSLTQGNGVLQDGNIWILAEADAWLATDHLNVNTNGGSSGTSCPLEGTILVPLGSPAAGRPFPNSEWVHIVLEDGKQLIATPKHPVYSDKRGKTALEDLDIEEEIITVDGMSKVKSKERRFFQANAVKVRMAKGHLYWAGGILSHNAKQGQL